MAEPVTYECTSLNEAGECQEWHEVTTPDDELVPALSQSEQSEITLAILSVMAFVWAIKQVRRLI